MLIRTFREPDAPAVVRLWERAGLTRPWNDPARDIARKLAVGDELFLVGEVGGADAGGSEADAGASGPGDRAIVGSAMVGYDGHRGWVNYLAVDPEHRGRGHARALMAEAERRLLALGCPKLNLQVRTGNDAALAFYARLGYSVDAATSLGKRLIPDGPARDE